MIRLIVAIWMFAASPAWAGSLAAMLGGSPPANNSPSCEGSNTYFGEDVSPENDWSNSPNWWFKYENVTFSPSSNGNVCSMEIYSRNDGTAGNIRVAIYDSGDNLVCSSTEKSVSSGTGAWITWDSTEITPVGGSQGDRCDVTSTTSYKPAFSIDSSHVYANYYGGGTSGDGEWATGDYTGGFPATLTGGGATYALPLIRFGVQ